MDRYLNEEVVSALPRDEQGRLFVDELRSEVARLVTAGPLAPATSILIYGREFHFANSGDTLLALAEALPWLDDAGRAAAVHFALEELARRDPLRPHEVPAFAGARREFFTPISIEDQELLCGTKGKASPASARGLSVAVTQESCANNVYALWSFARASGEWDWMRERWEQIKSAAFSGRRWSDWATCGHFWHPSENRGSAGAVNGQFARWIGLARIARRFGDRDCEERAATALARAALLRFAQGKVARHMYDEKFQTIDAEPDWMRQLSTAPGESGPSLLWTDRWGGADDDMRQVIRWGECGPVIALVDGDQVRPILPPLLELTPECGRFLGDHLGAESRRFIAAVERNAPDWFVTLRAPNIGEVHSTDSPRNSLSIFLGQCYALGQDDAAMMRCQDIPFCRVGDLYHLRKLTANLLCLGGLKWRAAAQAQQERRAQRTSSPKPEAIRRIPPTGAAERLPPATSERNASDAPGNRVAVSIAKAGGTHRMIDFTDPSYGGRVRQIYNPDGDEHDLYHYRSVFNADNSRMLGIETPKGSTDYQVTLYDGDGRFLKGLFTQAEYDWRVAWDRREPKFLYTWKGSTVYRFDVEPSKPKALKTFENPSLASPSGLSLNEQGDRLLLRMTDKSVRTYRLPALDDERICQIEIPDGWYANWDKLRFTGHKDFFALTFEQKQPLAKGASFKPPFTRIYDGVTGKLYHTLDGITVGHHDFSPDGKLAYGEGFNERRDLKVHVVNLDGTGDTVVFTAPREKLRFVRNYHITWPAGVRDWFLLSFFPQTSRLPESYEPWLDELVQVFVDGRHRVLARTGTTCGANFWAQPQQSPSADGTRVLFHSNGTCTVGEIGCESSGTIDQCILYLK